MKKAGFTLSEMLIVMGIIGVIAALTLPTLNTNTTTAQIGPKLAKAVSMFDQANAALLNANSVDTLTDAGLLGSVGDYATELSKHFKISAGANGYLSKDGMLYNFSINSTPPTNSSEPGHMQRIGNITIDINGDSKPNIAGTDIFYFSWWNDGSLRPKGATNWEPGGDTWTTRCPNAEVGTVTGDGYQYCAGHIFENNLKVLYE